MFPFLCFLLLMVQLNGSNSDIFDIPKLDSRIVGGTAATIEDFPYQVSIMYIDHHMCGGSLIHPLYILTAAHCTDELKPAFLLVRAGSSFLDQGGQVRSVQEIYQHPNYSTDSMALINDVSILKLSSSFDISNVQVIALPQQNASLVDNQQGWVTGWGRLSENGPLPFELQKVQLPIMNTNNCNSVYSGYISDVMFCAGFMAGGKDSCQGDSGGPFALNGVLVGVTSWGDGCARPNNPGVYAKVSMFRDFIDQYINDK